MKIYLVKKEKNRIYKSEDMVLALTGRNLVHNEKGAPQVDGGYVSISDTKGFWACALSDVPVGIDMEELSRKVSPSVVKKLHAAEREYLSVLSEGSSEWQEEFLSIWTKKEAYSKYKGKGLGLGFSGFCVLDGMQDALETGLYSGKYRGLVFAATEEFEIVPVKYDAPFSKSALDAGADILDMFGCSAKTLKGKLLDRGYGEGDAAEAVEKLKDLGFLDDSAYAESFGRKYAARGYSSRRIELELKKKGVSPEDAAAEALKHKDGDFARAALWAEKTLGGAEADEKNKAKVARKLSALGYDTYTIYDIIGDLGKER